MVNPKALSIFTRTSGLASLLRKAGMQGQRSLRCMTPRKALNLVLLRAEMVRGRSRLRSYPYHYVIDPVNYCILRCPLCPTGRGTLIRKKGQLSIGDYRRVVDQVAPYALSIDLYNWGEPLLHNNVFDMVAYARERRVSAKISTNLNVLNETRIGEIIESGLDELVISLDGADQATYEKYRVGGDLAKVLWGVRELVAEKRRRKSPRPWITVRVLLHRGNEGEIAQIRQLAWSLGVNNVVVAPILVNIDRPQDVEEWLPGDSRYSYYDYRSREDKTVARTGRCPFLWERMVISWDGGVSPCCWYDNPSNDFGNILKEGVEAIWNGPRYVSARDVFGGCRSGAETICSQCRGRPRYEY